jgi:hypothetical protein
MNMAEKRRGVSEELKEHDQEHDQEHAGKDFFANMDARLQRYREAIATLHEELQALRNDWLLFNRDAAHQMNHMSQVVKQNRKQPQPQPQPHQEKGG